MKKLFIFLLVIVALALYFTFPVSAHGGTPRIEISAERLNPGGVLEIRGVEFGYDDVVTLALIGGPSEIALGESIANAEGEFKQIVVLPSDLSEGTYYVRGKTSHHWALSPPLAVWGATVLNGEEGEGARTDEDGLLAPMPTYAPAVPTAFVSSAPAESMPMFNWRLFMVVISLLLLIGLAVVFFSKEEKCSKHR